MTNDHTYINPEGIRLALDKGGVTWPLGGFHPGPVLAMCRCPVCDGVFVADKKSVRCLPCAIDDVRSHHAAWCRMSAELTEIVEMDELRSGVSDPGHFAYPAFCAAARIRLAAMERNIEALEPVVELLEGVEA